MADDWSAIPKGFFNDQRTDRLTTEEKGVFYMVWGWVNDWGLFSGSSGGLARLIGIPEPDMAKYLRLFELAKLIERYEVTAVDGVDYKVGMITAFYAYQGHANTRAQESMRRRSEWPLKDGTFPATRSHKGKGDITEATQTDNQGLAKGEPMGLTQGANPRDKKSGEERSGAQRSDEPRRDTTHRPTAGATAGALDGPPRASSRPDTGNGNPDPDRAERRRRKAERIAKRDRANAEPEPTNGLAWNPKPGPWQEVCGGAGYYAHRPADPVLCADWIRSQDWDADERHGYRDALKQGLCGPGYPTDKAKRAAWYEAQPPGVRLAYDRENPDPVKIRAAKREHWASLKPASAPFMDAVAARFPDWAFEAQADEADWECWLAKQPSDLQPVIRLDHEIKAKRDLRDPPPEVLAYRAAEEAKVNAMRDALIARIGTAKPAPQKPEPKPVALVGPTPMPSLQGWASEAIEARALAIASQVETVRREGVKTAKMLHIWCHDLADSLGPDKGPATCNAALASIEAMGASWPGFDREVTMANAIADVFEAVRAAETGTPPVVLAPVPDP